MANDALINTLMIQYMYLHETILNNFLTSPQDAELGICAPHPHDFQSCCGISQGRVQNGVWWLKETMARNAGGVVSRSGYGVG